MDLSSAEQRTTSFFQGFVVATIDTSYSLQTTLGHADSFLKLCNWWPFKGGMTASTRHGLCWLTSPDVAQDASWTDGEEAELARSSPFSLGKRTSKISSISLAVRPGEGLSSLTHLINKCFERSISEPNASLHKDFGLPSRFKRHVCRVALAKVRPSTNHGSPPTFRWEFSASVSAWPSRLKLARWKNMTSCYMSHAGLLLALLRPSWAALVSLHLTWHHTILQSSLYFSKRQTSCLGHILTRDLMIMSWQWWRYHVTQQSVREICLKQGDGVHIANNLTHCYRQVSLPFACKHFREQVHVMLLWPRSGACMEMLAICKWCRFALPQGFQHLNHQHTSLTSNFQTLLYGFAAWLSSRWQINIQSDMQKHYWQWYMG